MVIGVNFSTDYKEVSGYAKKQVYMKDINVLFGDN